MHTDMPICTHARTRTPLPVPATGFWLSGIVGLKAVPSPAHKECLTASYPRALAKMILNMRVFKSHQGIREKCQNRIPGSFQHCCWAEDIE